MKDINKKLKVLFAGTAEFAIPSFELLLNNDKVEVVGLLTQPDRPVGRKQVLNPTPVKSFLLGSRWVDNVPVFTPERLSKEAEAILAATNPDIIVVAAYGQFVPSKMLEGPKLGAINIHGSLLPELRGAVPVQMAILQGLAKTGVTIQKMVKDMDAGDVLGKKEYVLTGTETTEILMKELADLGAKLLSEILPDLGAGGVESTPQNEAQATFCYQQDIAKQNAEISAQTNVYLAERMVRAFYPWPIAWYKVDSGPYTGKRIKVFSSKVSNLELPKTQSNTLFEYDERLFLNLGGGCLELLEIQLEGKQRRPASEYLWLTQ